MAGSEIWQKNVVVWPDSMWLLPENLVQLRKAVCVLGEKESLGHFRIMFTLSRTLRCIRYRGCPCEGPDVTGRNFVQSSGSSSFRLWCAYLVKRQPLSFLILDSAHSHPWTWARDELWKAPFWTTSCETRIRAMFDLFQVISYWRMQEWKAKSIKVQTPLKINGIPR